MEDDLDKVRFMYKQAWTKANKDDMEDDVDDIKDKYDKFEDDLDKSN